MNVSSDLATLLLQLTLEKCPVKAGEDGRELHTYIRDN